MTIMKPEKDPAVLVPDGRTDTGVEPLRYDGKLVRVYPTKARDVFALQMLDHHREKFAPVNGGGVMVTPEALAKITPRS